MVRLPFYLLFISLLLAAKASAQDAKLVIQSGHTKTVSAAAFTRDGKYLITGGEDNICVLWDVVSQKSIQYYQGHTSIITSIAVSADNKYFVTASNDKTLIQWDLFTGKILNRFKGHTREVNDVVLCSNNTIVSGSFDGTMKCWDLGSGKLIKTLKTMSSYKLALSPNEKLLINSNGEALEWWDLVTYKKIFSITINKLVHAIAFTPDGQTLLIGTGNIYTSSGNTVRMYDVATRTIKKQIDYPSYVQDISVSSDGKYIGVAGGSSYGKIYETLSGKEIFDKCPSGKKVIFAPDAQHLLIAGGYKGTILTEVTTGLVVKSFVGYAQSIEDVVFPPYSHLLYSGAWDKYLRKWDLENGKLENSIQIESSYVDIIAVSPDGETVVEKGGDSEMKFTNKNLSPAEWKLSGRLFTHFLCFIDDSTVVCNYTSTEKSPYEDFIQLINLRTRKTVNKIKTKDVIYHALLTPGKDKLIAVLENSVLYYDLKTGQIVKKLSGYSKIPGAFTDQREILSLAISNNGKWLAAGLKRSYCDSTGSKGDFEKYKYYSNYCVRIWDFETGALVKDMEGPKEIISNIAFAPDDKTLACGTGLLSGSQENTIRIYDLNTFTLIKTLTEHSDAITALRYSPDGKHLVSASKDGSIRLWDSKTYAPIASLVGKDQYDYIIATPDNYYTSSKAGMNLMAFNYQNKGFSFEQFDLQLNRPDIVLQRLGYASPALIESYKKAYEKRLKKTGFTESMFSKDFQLPVLTVPHQNLALSTPKKSIKLFVSASDSLYKLDRINVLVNGVPLNGLKGISVKDKQSSSFSDSVEIRLSSGVNKISINTMNSAGATSLPFQYTITCTDNSRKPDLYLISIGVSEYKSKEMNLTYATKDAKDLTQLFTGSTSKYGNIIVDTIFDKDMTVEKIMSLKNKLANTKEDDQVIVFIAGHGLLDADLNYYLATHEIDFMNPAKKGLAYEQLEHVLDGIPARRKLLLMDACHSGEVDKEEVQLVAKAEKTEEGEIQFRSIGNTQVQRIGLENSFEMMKNLFTDLRKGSGTIVISSAGGGEYAMEGSQWKNGVFTYSLIKGLKEKKADVNKDGKIMASELQEYLQQSVSELTKGKQKPTSRTEIMENDFQVW